MHCGGNNVSPVPTHRHGYVGEEGELPHEGVPDAIPRCGGVDGEELGTDCGEEPVLCVIVNVISRSSTRRE